jgi:2-polyprenyl-3-methyl-5-hydroxy-6-metoxy-1,4-benzoquinol methylase
MRDGTPRYKGTLDESARDRFYATGAVEADFIGETLQRLGASSSHFSSILEFGCGLGRVSRWLCQDFDRVIGVDLLQRYLDIGAQELRARGVTNFTPLRLRQIRDLANLPDYKVFYPRYVLQHNPPPVIRVILTYLLLRLSPGGVAIFQVPIFGQGYRFSVAVHLAKMSEIAWSEMHVFPRWALEDLINEEGCVLLEARETDDVGEQDWRSKTFVVRKRPF